MAHRAAPLTLALLLAWSLLAGAGVGVATVPTTHDVAQQATPEPPPVDNTVTRIELAADGAARWHVTIRTRLETETDADEYRAFQARFRENNSRFLDPFRSRIRAVVSNAAAATGREMAAADFAAETHVQEVPRRWGVVTFTFTWEGFARVEDGTVRVGDAFAGGFFLAANDTLTVVVPDGYAVTRVEPAPDDRREAAVSWTGRVDFADGRPLVHAAPSTASAATTGTPGAANTPFGVIGIGAALLAAVAGMAYLSFRRRGPAPAALATDDERVLELLESRGGRLPQSAVVEAFGWSTSKTSRVLSRMAEEGAIEKLQVGRKNLIRLPDDERTG